MNGDNDTPLRGFSDAQIASEIRPFLEEAYGDVPDSDAWLDRLASVIKDDLDKPADAVNLAAWAFDDAFRLDEEAENALASEKARPVLVRLIAELAHVVLLDTQTAQTIIEGLKRHFAETEGWDGEAVAKPIRAALTGRAAGLSLPQAMSLLGRERCMNRAAAILRRA